MLYREPSPEEPTLSEGKTLIPSKPAQAKLNDQGLYFFSLIDFAPPSKSLLPFYFQTGLLYKGLIPTRDQDQLGIALAYGSFSFNNIQAQQQKGNVNQQNYIAVLFMMHK